MGICPCGYWWADCDEEGTPITNEYCHFDGPDSWAPCEQDEYDKYANEARIEEEEAREEAEYENWIASMPEEQRPTNVREYVESWKQFRNRYEDYETDEYLDWLYSADYDEAPTFEEYGAPYDYQEF